MASGKLQNLEVRQFGLTGRLFSQGRKTPIVNKKKNILVFCGLLTSVIGIYTYSMYSVKIDKIDFDK